MEPREETVAIEGGAVPVTVLGPEPASALPGLVVVPSIFGVAPDLLKRLGELASHARIVAPDPFWRVEPGPIPYEQIDRARGRVQELDLAQCVADLRAVIEWTRARCSGRVVGLGICFGGPFVLLAAADRALAGVVTWHGSRMERFLERAGEIRCPLRMHFGADDPITPPEAIERIRTAFASHPDVSIVVHPGATHGYSHDGPAYLPEPARAGLDATREVLLAASSKTRS